jgi:hypothetical protein
MCAQVGLPGMAGYGSQHKDQGRPQALHDKPLFDRAAQLTNLVHFQTGVWSLMN